MTTFLLHGGGTSKDSIENNRFFAQFTDLVEKSEVSVLLCYWSRKLNEWEGLQSRDSAKILLNTSKKITFHVAQDPEDLFVQIKSSDVLYVAGGEAELIEPFYKNLGDLKSVLEGKVYAGSSMGAFLASEQYVLSFDSQNSNTVHKGVGLLPIQTLCHWDKEVSKSRKLTLLRNTQSESPIITLNECEFVSMQSGT